MSNDTTAKFNELVAAKRAAGLSQRDAEEVAQRQIEHDAAMQATAPAPAAESDEAEKADKKKKK